MTTTKRARTIARMAVLSFAAALAGAGCGGCETCGGKPVEETASSNDIARPLDTAVAPTLDAAAAPNDARDDATSAASKEASTPSPTTPILPLAVSAPPRPSGAPMPLGAYQSCGVYEGPLCTRLCPKGNCRQECDGVDCVLSCTGGYCSQLCGASATCRLSCPGGHCVQVCSAPGCTRDCLGGNCE